MEWSNLLSDRRFTDKEGEINRDPGRSRFEQDIDRIIFSQPFRKLQDKTQVFPLPEDDFVHTRLTHSLEVSSVGRSLGKNAGRSLLAKYPELKDQITIEDIAGITASACLAHDLGNPPFGHAGEEGISSYFKGKGAFFEPLVEPPEWEDLCQFEGNAQGFRILNSPLYRGTALTFATLGAFTKYPLSSVAKKQEGRKSHKKYGFYQSEATHFDKLAAEMKLQSVGRQAWIRHPLAFLVESADDICYSIIDLEDACRLDLVPFDLVKKLLAAIIGSSYSEEKLEQVPSLNEKLGILRAMAIHTLIKECSEVFDEKEEEMRKGEFDEALTDLIPSASVLRDISILSVDKIYRSKPVLEREAGGYEVIDKLMDAFCRAAYANRFEKAGSREKSVFRLMPEEFKLEIRRAETPYEVLRLVCDYISGLTDRYAIRLYKITYGL